MIHPGIRIVDVDPEGFAWLNALIGRRATTAPATVTVLHDGDRVVNAVSSVASDPVDLGDAVLDPASLRAALGVDRVILIERRELAALGAAVVHAARDTDVQPELLARAHDLFWSHPAVRTDPPPPLMPWRPVAEALQRLGSATVVVRIIDTLELVARVEGGLVTVLSGPPGPGPDGADLVIELTAEEVEHIVLAPDPVDALRALPALADLL